MFKTFPRVLAFCFAMIFAFMLAMPWMIVGFDRYAHWVASFR